MGIFANSLDKFTQAINKVAPADSNPYGSLANNYQEEKDAGVDGGAKAPGVQSLFNAFNVFRYSKFGSNTGTYDLKHHMDAASNEDAQESKSRWGRGFKSVSSLLGGQKDSEFKSFNDERQKIENPTASTIIEWAKQQGGKEPNSGVTPMPYASSDFLWCKYYGKVPNNRMLTLRRYPVPVEDNLANFAKSQSPFTPLAQAVSWYGTDIDNDLNKILNINWGFKWKPLNSDVTDVAGNEIRVDDLLKELGVSGKDGAIYQAAKNGLFSGKDSIGMAEITGYDTDMQKYIKEAYGDKGPYWNRILGPVNVVNDTLIRDRGFKFMEDITINFDYSLRSYGNINPKIAFLDLMTNFLSLTYNTAPFWGGQLRYFAKTGVKLDPLGMEESILNSDVPQAIKDGIDTITKQVRTTLDGYKKAIERGLAGASGVTKNQFDSASETDVLDTLDGIASKIVAGKLGAFMQPPLSYRSILDGRAIGEWHLTIGNPMSPMAMMGNLVVSDVKMTVGEVLGIDDFPTEFRFKVTLKHGKPRAKQEIESIFNLGGGPMTSGALPQPSSASNSLGGLNTIKSQLFSTEATNLKNTRASAEEDNEEQVKATAFAIESAKRTVSSFYGDAYGNSNSLPNYFKNYVTKD